MRPNQQNNKQRSRNRGNNNRRGGNPLSRNYESNGPDVRVRGNAAHIAEKYVQLARDAAASGDGVMAENYLQHAEHYFRIISAAQAQFQQRDGNGFAGERDEAEDDGFDDQPQQRAQFARGEPREQREPERAEEGGEDAAEGPSEPKPQPARRQRRAPQPAAEPASEAAPAPAETAEAAASEEGESRPRRTRRPRRPRVAEDDGTNGELPAFLTGGQETAAE